MFITGTDTGVGKTYLTSRLIKVLRQHGLSLTARKPVESGCQKTSEGSLFPDDGNHLFEAVGNESLETITPYCFEAALAPPIAAHLEGTSIKLKELSESCLPTHGPLIVEGAGGLLSPIAEDGLNADLAVALKLPILIAAPDRLGCINHCLLTCEAAEKRGLKIIAIVLNQIDTMIDERMNNAEELRRLTPYPVLEISHLDNNRGIEDLASIIIDQGWVGEPRG